MAAQLPFYKLKGLDYGAAAYWQLTEEHFVILHL